VFGVDYRVLRLDTALQTDQIAENGDGHVQARHHFRDAKGKREERFGCSFEVDQGEEGGDLGRGRERVRERGFFGGTSVQVSRGYVSRGLETRPKSEMKVSN
jgi:hypothetical protein